MRYWMLFNRFLMIAWRSSTPRAPMLSTAGVHVLLTLADGPRHCYASTQTVVAGSSGTVQSAGNPTAAPCSWCRASRCRGEAPR
jgi:hypothetical protein